MRLSADFLKNKVHYKNYLLILVICLLAFWPLTFSVFSVKNDAIHYFLPYRFNISEALRNGQWPFWSPYIYLGYPVFGDMQSGAWNPLVWVLSFLGRYDITTFQYENLLYIFLGAIGMYKLTNHFIKNTQTALLIAISYMLSGFMASGQLINWLAAAAFIPFVIYYYLRIQTSASYTYAIKAGIALYFLLTAGYPSFFIFTAYFLLFLFITRLTEVIKLKKEKGKWWQFLLHHSLLFIVFGGLSLPAIISYIDLLPFYQRGEGIPFAEAIKNSFEWQHLVTLLFPSAIKGVDISSSTDITFRNLYIGLFPLLILFSLPPKFTKRNILLCSLAVFSLLFSLGDLTPLRKICYKSIPLMDTFRHPSQMRLFFIFSLLLLSAPGVKKIMQGYLSGRELKRLKINVIILVSLLFLIAVLSFLYSTFGELSLSLDSRTFINTLKQLIESATLADAVSSNSFLQFLFAGGFAYWVFKWRQNKSILILLWVANLFLFLQLVLPITFVSKTSPKEINQFIHASPMGFPVSGLEKTIGENSRDAMTHFDKIALPYFYNKKIGISRVTNSPSFLTEQEEFINSALLYKYVSSLPVIYQAGKTALLKDTLELANMNPHSIAFTEVPIKQLVNYQPGDRATLLTLTNNKFEIETNNSSTGFLVLTQNFHPGWQATIDGQKATIYKTNLSFMGCLTPPGTHNVVFKFTPRKTLAALWIQFGLLLVLAIASLIFIYKKYTRIPPPYYES